MTCFEGETGLFHSWLAFIWSPDSWGAFDMVVFKLQSSSFPSFPNPISVHLPIDFASFQYICLCMNIGVYIPAVFSLTLNCCLHCPSLCWTHLHLCKEWEWNSTLQCPICSSHCTGVKDKIWDCQEFGLAQATQALSYVCNLRFKKHGNHQFSCYAVVQWYGIA